MKEEEEKAATNEVFKSPAKGNGSTTIFGVKEVLAEMETEEMAPMSRAMQREGVKCAAAKIMGLTSSARQGKGKSPK